MISQKKFRPHVLALVRRQPNEELVDALRSMLADAEQGKIVGFIGAAHYGAAEFSYTGCGSLCNNPLMGIGALIRLKQKLL